MDESLNRAVLANGAPPPAIAANGHDPALIAEAKRLVETTTISQTRIGATLGLTSQAISNLSRAGGWQRPAGAPQAPRLSRASRSPVTRTDAVAARRERLVMRFYRACERQLALVERKLRRPRAEMEEKDVRALGLLAKTLGTLMALGENHLVLLGVLEAGEFGHPHLIAMGFQIKPAQHIGEMGAEFPPLDGMAPELIQRPFHVIQGSRQFGLAAGHQGDEFGVMVQGEQNRLVGGGVAGVQRGDNIHRPGLSSRDAPFHKIHPLEAAVGGNGLCRFDQIGAALDGNHPAPPGGRKIQIVEDKPKIGFARPQIGQHRLVFLHQHGVDGGADKLSQMLDLFELAAAVGIQPALAGQDVQGFQQGDGLARPKIGQWIGFFGPWIRFFRMGGHGPTIAAPAGLANRPHPR